MSLSLQPLLTWRGALLSLLLLLAVAALASLGLWQLHRGQQKKLLIETYEQALKATPVPLNRFPAAVAPDHWMPVSLRGSYLADRQLLLDNQSQGEVAGFDVWTPLRMDDGTLVMIDRGWLPHGRKSELPAAPAGTVELHGFWRNLPVPGLRLKADNCSNQGWPRAVEYPTIEDLRCLYAESPLPGVVLLSTDEGDGLVREWHPAPGFPPERHYAYAAQWFGLSLTLLILSLRVLLKSST
jgi:cytochrome oxidase assembly protein ShyY1